MKLVTRVKLTGTLLAGVLLTLASVAANAAGTAANTPINNRATVNYKVGGVAQSPIGSSPTGNFSGAGSDTTFVVDAKMILSVTNNDGADITTNTAPGQTGAASKFTVTNNGNSTVDAILSSVNMPTSTSDPNGGTSDIAITTSDVYTDATCTTTIHTISNLAVGGSQSVYVCSTIPGAAVDGDIAVIGLLAKVGKAGSGVALGTDDSGAAWNSAAEQFIFSEPASAHAATGDSGAYDGNASDLGAYKVKSAKLTITKTSSVITDPIYCTTPGNAGSCTIPGGKHLHSIPGAVMKYTVTIVNSGTSDATSVGVSDDLTTQITTNGYLAWLTGGMSVQTPGVNSGSAFACADDGVNTTTQAATGGGYTAVTCDYNKTAATTVTVGGITLKNSDTATITYEVTIQ